MFYQFVNLWENVLSVCKLTRERFISLWTYETTFYQFVNLWENVLSVCELFSWLFITLWTFETTFYHFVNFWVDFLSLCELLRWLVITFWTFETTFIALWTWDDFLSLCELLRCLFITLWTFEMPFYHFVNWWDDPKYSDFWLGDVLDKCPFQLSEENVESEAGSVLSWQLPVVPETSAATCVSGEGTGDTTGRQQRLGEEGATSPQARQAARRRRGQGHCTAVEQTRLPHAGNNI